MPPLKHGDGECGDDDRSQIYSSSLLSSRVALEPTRLVLLIVDPRTRQEKRNNHDFLSFNGVRIVKSHIFGI